jgi:hypothetical protein
MLRVGDQRSARPCDPLINIGRAARQALRTVRCAATNRPLRSGEYRQRPQNPTFRLSMLCHSAGRSGVAERAHLRLDLQSAQTWSRQTPNGPIAGSGVPAAALSGSSSRLHPRRKVWNQVWTEHGRILGLARSPGFWVETRDQGMLVRMQPHFEVPEQGFS